MQPYGADTAVGIFEDGGGAIGQTVMRHVKLEICLMQIGKI